VTWVRDRAPLSYRDGPRVTGDPPSDEHGSGRSSSGGGVVGPEELERVEALLSAVAFRHLDALLEEREDVMVALLDAELRTRWSLPRGTGDVFRRWSVGSGLIDLHGAVAEKDRARFEAAVSLALRGESVEFLGVTSPADGRALMVRTIMWPTNDRSAVVSATTIEGETPEAVENATTGEPAGNGG
jgi:hypothetical protein